MNKLSQSVQSLVDRVGPIVAKYDFISKHLRSPFAAIGGALTWETFRELRDKDSRLWKIIELLKKPKWLPVT